MRDSLLWGPFLQDYEDFQRKILQGNKWLSPQDNILPFFPIPLLLFIHWRGVWKTLVQKLKQNVHSFFPITFKIHLPSHHTFEKLHINLKKKKKWFTLWQWTRCFCSAPNIIYAIILSSGHEFSSCILLKY